MIPIKSPHITPTQSGRDLSLKALISEMMSYSGHKTHVY